MNNTLTGKEVPEAISGLFNDEVPTGRDVTLKPTDPAFWHYAAFRGLIGLPEETMTWPASLPEKSFWTVPVADMTPEGRTELDFLDSLGLLYMEGDAVYLSPLAEVLYGPAGLFRNPKNPEACLEMARLFRDFVLPGRLWRAYIAREGLPNDVSEAVRLDAEMADVRSMLSRLDEVDG